MRPAFNEKRSFRPSFSFVSSRNIRREQNFLVRIERWRVFALIIAQQFISTKTWSRFYARVGLKDSTVALEGLIIKSKQGEVSEKT